MSIFSYCPSGKRCCGIESRDQVKESLRQLSGMKADLGLVLSQISASGMNRYGYGGKYGSYAAYGSAYYDD